MLRLSEFNLKRIEEQNKLKALSEKKQSESINKAHDEAILIDKFTGKDGSKEDIDLDIELLGEKNYKETPEKYLGGDFTINPKGSNKVFLDKQSYAFEDSEYPTPTFNKEISLSQFTKISELDKCSEYADLAKYRPGYIISQVINNSIVRGELDDETIINILEWNKGLGRDETYGKSEKEGRDYNGEKRYDYEAAIAESVAGGKLLTKKVAEWLVKNRRSDRVFYELSWSPFSSEQRKEIALNVKSAYLKYNMIEEGIINAENFTFEEIEKIYFNTNAEDGSRFILCRNIIQYLFPKFNEDQKKEFIVKALNEIIDGYKNILEKSEAEGKLEKDEVCYITKILAKDEKGKEVWYPSSYPEILRELTENSKYISDEQIISLMKNSPWFMGGFSENLPGWVFHGLILLHGPNDNYQHRAIIDFNKPEYKEKYALMEELFGEKESVDKILTKREQQEMMDEVKLIGLRKFRPVYAVEPKEGETETFKHISGRPGLKYLLPYGSRGTDRYLHDYAVYMQKGDYLEGWQREHLHKINHGYLHKYSITIPKEALEKYIVYKDDRWEGGYMTRQPIILDKNIELTWEVFNPVMKVEAIDDYERIFGKLPQELKNRLMEGGTPEIE